MRIVRLAKTFAICGALALGTAACSGGQQDDEKPEVSEEDSPAEPTDTVVEEPAAPEPEPMAAIPEPAAPAAPAPAAAPGGVEPGRVVRYVKVQELKVHGQAADGAAAVGTLYKGDRVLVVEEGGWGRIADGMFVKLDSLSRKAVDRNRVPAVWNPPGN